MPREKADYDQHREEARLRIAEMSRSGRDIAPIPAVAKLNRRKKCAKSLRAFCETYLPQVFYLPWSQNHLAVLQKIERATLVGGSFAVAMPRGSGKSSMALAAAEWAILYGHQRFVLLIANDEGSATSLIENIRTELETNDLLLADFPEACYPIRKLEGIPHRAGGQLCNGERTHVACTTKELVLPTIKGSVSSGAVIRVAGITGRIRGMNCRAADGALLRPGLVIIDDPQTDESARSVSQSAQREAILAGAVLGLAGPGRRIAALMPCTVIRPGDMADSILNPEKHPEWQGERMRLVYSFPSDEALWKAYAKLRADGLRRGDGGKSATEFYVANRAAMDAGSSVAWEARYNRDEVSAIQSAMNLRFDLGDAAFFAEYQNEPLLEVTAESVRLPAEFVDKKQSGLVRRAVPQEATELTAYIDVHEDVLFWCVCAWAEDFSGSVIDYGTFPEQGRAYFTLRDAANKLSVAFPSMGLEGRIYAALEATATAIMSQPYSKADGTNVGVSQLLIDANWGQSTDTVYQFARQSAYSPLILPAHGRYFGASTRAMDEWRQSPGDRRGCHWFIPSTSRRAAKYVVVDVNYWKSFLYARFAVAMGDRGCLSLFGRNQPGLHRLFSDHIVAEYAVETAGRGRRVTEWKARPGSPDNHWFDCLVGCAAGASIRGFGLPGAEPVRQKKRRKYTQWDLSRRLYVP
ncbi:MAG TPA: terminase gpA endonuclease subunit [Dissulfurispiraceae bacterium]|nr:terminase gpA endonuclease subunit [Dissulfurispiraceae bacterium]